MATSYPYEAHDSGQASLRDAAVVNDVLTAELRVERKKLLLRLDPDVYDVLARWASDDLRSINAQIEYALRLALTGAGRRVRGRPSAEPES